MILVPNVSAQEVTIPDWIKNNAGWWAGGQIDDTSFVSGIQWLISNGIMIIPPTEQEADDGGNVIPDWIKNNAGWWAGGQIDDTSFVSGIQWLISNGIIMLEIKTCTKTFDLRGVFDTETGPIYWDQGHVSNRGNSIVAKSLFNTVFSIVSENYGFSTFETEKGIKKTSSLLYDDREIVVTVELLPSNESEDKKVKISTYDNTNNEDVLNVTYFLAISKNNENLLREYFFAKDGILIFDVFPDDSNQVQIFGEQQYDHNAYVMSNVTPLQVKGPIFSTDGIYAFDTELRTIDNINNWVFNLSGFHSEINIENDITFEETFTENRSSFQTEDLLRKIFSYYKTPILLNEIFS